MRCLSLYTGCGGLDLGFKQAGFKTVWANELSPKALETFAKEIQRTGGELPELVCGDISHTKLPEKHSADIVIGGPPCQGFSVAGRMNPNDPRSRHVWEFFRVVEHIDPEAFVMENVKALGVNERWKDIRNSLKRHGEKLGYQTRLLLLSAADFGVAQLRERMFLVGIKDKTMPSPEPTLPAKSVREALAELPNFGQIGNNSKCNAIITPAKKPVLRKSPFAGMLFNGQGRPVNLELPAPTLPASMGGNRTPIIDQMNLENPDIPPWIIEYHQRLIETGSVVGNVPSRLRRLTVEEAACLQGFPVGMEFEGSQCSKFSQIGNSVPPPLAEAVGEALKRRLASNDPVIEVQNDQKCWIAENESQYLTS